MKIGHKILIANPIGMFLVEIPGSPSDTGVSLWDVSIPHSFLFLNKFTTRKDSSLSVKHTVTQTF